MTAGIAQSCHCGALMRPINERHPEILVCPHCDQPCTRGTGQCDRCRRMSGPVK